jgi:hypothetical protein
LRIKHEPFSAKADGDELVEQVEPRDLYSLSIIEHGDQNNHVCISLQSAKPSDDAFQLICSRQVLDKHLNQAFLPVISQ